MPISARVPKRRASRNVYNYFWYQRVFATWTLMSEDLGWLISWLQVLPLLFSPGSIREQFGSKQFTACRTQEESEPASFSITLGFISSESRQHSVAVSWFASLSVLPFPCVYQFFCKLIVFMILPPSPVLFTFMRFPFFLRGHPAAPVQYYPSVHSALHLFFFVLTWSNHFILGKPCSRFSRWQRSNAGR